MPYLRITGSRLPMLVMIMMLMSVSCTKKTDDPVIYAPVSGVFKGDILPLNDSVAATVYFSFDELDDGTINGGVRIRIMGHKYNWAMQKYISHHSVGVWTKGSDDTTLVSGQADMGSDMGMVTFSGTITGSTFSYTLTGITFTAEGTAVYAGEYIRSESIKSSMTTDYTGTYTVACGEGTAIGSFGGYVYSDPFQITLSITSQAPDGYGGIAMYGYFTGNIPMIGANTHTLDDQSDYYPDDLQLSTDNYSFSFGGSDTNWDPATTYSCQYGYAIYEDAGGYTYVYEGSVNMSAKQ